ncbi:MAG TPA: hypothetical protein VM223_13805 [Planctomycetota bacterium]|nr:hypothetical protein [Planctomycetota bacterium]
MNDKEHKERHEELHKALDELMADFINHTGALPSRTSVFRLAHWSYEQTINPTPDPVPDGEEA